MESNTTYEYYFNELDKRALMGVLIIESFYKHLNIKIAQSEGYHLETLLVKGSQNKEISGIFTVVNYLNPKLGKTAADTDLVWKIFYLLTQLHVTIDKKKKTTTIRVNGFVLKELETTLKKTNYIQGGKTWSEIDIVAYINLADNIQKNSTVYEKDSPSIFKWYNDLTNKLSSLIESYQKAFPKGSKGGDDKTKENPDAKKEQAKKQEENQIKEPKQAEQIKETKEEKKKCKSGGDDSKQKKAKQEGEKGKNEEQPKKEEQQNQQPKKEEVPKDKQKPAKEPKQQKPANPVQKQAQANPKQGQAKKKDNAIDPETLEILNKCKIHRVHNDVNKAPHPTKKNVLITSALPYVNNVPHLGNIIGCVLSADVYARYCRLRGYNTLYICGTDEYGTATETKALLENTTPQEICNKYFKIHKEIYEWFDIDFDYFGRTTTQHQTDIAQDIFKKLHQKNLLSEDILEQPYCEGCKRFLADRFIEGICPIPDCKYPDARGDQCDSCGKLLDAAELIDPKCKICKTKPIIKQTKHIFLDLPEIKDDLVKWVNKSSVDGFWSSNSIQITNGWIKQGLKKRCITRDLKWGTPVPLEGFEDKVFYVWFDAPIGYISITANYTQEWEKWWKNPNQVSLYQFMGKDNIPFHTVIFPCTLLGTQEPWTLLHHVSTTEYLNYESGKFSKSRGVGVFGDNAKNSSIPSEVWRYYLLINRPEQSDTEFNWDDFAAKNNNELLANVGNMLNRSLKFIYSKLEQCVPKVEEKDLADSDKQLLVSTWEKFNEYIKLLESVEIKNSLKVAMEISSLCNKYLQLETPWVEEKLKSGRSAVVLFIVANLIRLIGAIFEPFMPSFSAKIYHILGINRTETDEEYLKYLLSAADHTILLRLVPAGQKLNKPVPLFTEITQDDVQNYRSKYGGNGNNAQN